MSTMEKLLVQIFQRKNRIIDQVQAQIDLFDQHHASKLLIDGIDPPSWLRNPTFAHSRPLDPSDMTTEDLISDIIRSRPQFGIPFSSNCCSVYEEPVPAAPREELPNGVLSDVSSPQDGADARFADTDQALSLARVQRSKSRQRALELRNSEKSRKSRFHGGSSQQTKFFSELFEVDDLSKLVKSSSGEKSQELFSVNGKEISSRGKYIDGDMSRNTGSHGTVTNDRIPEAVSSSVSEQIITQPAHATMDRSRNVEGTISDRKSSLIGEDQELCAENSTDSSDKENVENELVGQSTGRQLTSTSQEALSLVNSHTLGRRVTRSMSTSNKPLQKSLNRSVSTGNKEMTGVEVKHLPCKRTSEVDLGRRVTRSRSAASNKPLGTNLSNRFESIGNQELCGVEGKHQPSNSARKLADQDIGTVKETGMDSDRSDEVQSISLRSNLDGADIGVGVEDVSFLSHNTMLVNPNRLNFDDAEESGLNRISTPTLNIEDERGLSEKCYEMLLEPADMPLVEQKEALSEEEVLREAHTVDIDEDMTALEQKEALSEEEVPQEAHTVDIDEDMIALEQKEALSEEEVPQEAHTVDIDEDMTALEQNEALSEEEVPQESHTVDIDKDMTALEQKEALSEEEVPQEAHTVDIDEDMTVLDENVGLEEEEISDMDKNMVVNNLSSDKKAIQKSSLTNPSITLHVTPESVHGSLLKTVANSNMSIVVADKEMNPSFETEIGEPVRVKHTELFSKESKLDTFSSNDPEPSKDADCPSVTNSGLLENRDACGDFTSEFLSAALEDGTIDNLAQSTVNSDLPQHHNADSLERCCRDDIDVRHSPSTECQIAEKSTARRSFSPSVEGSGSWTQNKRQKVGLIDILSISPDTKENAFHPEPSLKGIVEFQGLPNSEEDTPQLVVRSEVEEMNVHHSVEDKVKEKTDYSPSSQVQEADDSLKARNSNSYSPFLFTHEELGAFRTSYLSRKAIRDSQGLVIDEVRVARQTSITSDGADETIPVLEGFVMQTGDGKPSIDERISFDKLDQSKSAIERASILEQLCKSACIQSPVSSCSTSHKGDGQPYIEEGISFDKLEQPKSAIEHASILEELCKSACMQSPVSSSSTSQKLHKVSNLYHSVPTGLLEGMDGKNKPPISDAVKEINDSYGCLSEEISRFFNGRSYSDVLPTLNSRWDIRKPPLSPVAKVWDRISLKLGSSEKKESLIPELPCITEENENVEEMADSSPKSNEPEVLTCSLKRKPLAEIFEIPNSSASGAVPYADRFSIESENTEFSFSGTHDRPKKKLGNQKSSKIRYNNKESQTPTVGANGVKRATESSYNRFKKPKLTGKTSLREGGPSLSEMEPKRKNIVSSITSFIPLVQQKQAAAALPVKRDIKVKALEAAEAAKRLAEKKENERKTKKEALKIERARQEKENLRQLELQKKKKEEERKKKGADMAAKKRQREEEEKKEKERKRMRLEEARKQQREHEQKLHAQKQEKDKKFRTTNERGHETKDSKDERGKHKTEKEKGHSLQNLSDAATTTTQLSTSDERRPGTIHEDYEATSDFRNNMKVNNLEKTIENKSFSANTIREQSYDISPYKESDDEDEDEDEDEDDKPNNKPVPLWASKINVALAREYQNQLDPEKIFPPEVSCSIAEVLLPRKYRL
ncbi:hypothetical protein UlMin_003865 [Ulmus minor]